jgi:hypothetical protein
MGIQYDPGNSIPRRIAASENAPDAPPSSTRTRQRTGRQTPILPEVMNTNNKYIFPSCAQAKFSTFVIAALLVFAAGCATPRLGVPVPIQGQG